MIAQRSTQQALRRLAASKPSMISQMVAKNFVAPLVGASQIQIRPVTTQHMNVADSHDILVAQRKLRPTAPHLTIYKPQTTWILSSLNRITGAMLSGGFYVFGAAYLVSPLFGWHLDSASMAAAFGAWPLLLKIAAKFTVAMPFTFHSINGLRHLTWDLGAQLLNQQVIRTGLIASGLSVACALGLAVFV